MVSYKDLLQKWRDMYWEWVLENKDDFPDSDSFNMHNYTKYDSDWFWESISENINITWDTIYQNLEYPWDMSYVSKNKNITPDIVEKYPDMFSDWNWYYLCKNINFTLPVFLKNMDKQKNQWINFIMISFAARYIGIYKSTHIAPPLLFLLYTVSFGRNFVLIFSLVRFKKI